MNKQFAKKRCVWVVLALFSALAVMGDGLHFLPGLGHDCWGTHRQLAAFCDSYRPDCAEAGQHQDLTAISVVPNSENCPVCQYFTQAQSVATTVVFEIDYHVVEGRIPTIRPLLVDHVAGAYCSRAPPTCG